jgi:antibiotic biosynthesis monooxygenase (ABM) superfamily enzyme
MTTAAPGRPSGPRTSDAAASGPATLVLSRIVRPGHAEAFEAVLHRLAAEARTFPGHQGLTVLRPQPGGSLTYTVVAHFATVPDMDAWLASDVRARLIAEADEHAADGLRTRYLSGLEGWLAPPGGPVVLPSRWKIVVVSLVGIAPLLELVTYLLAPHLTALPVWGRPLIAASLIVPLMQYGVMPALTRLTRGLLYTDREERPHGPS